jgi:hypothetical protein
MYQNHMAMPFGDILGCEQKSVYIPFTASGNNEAFVGKDIPFNPDTDLDYTNSIITGIEVIDLGTATNAMTQPIRQNADTSILVNVVLTLSHLTRDNAKSNKMFWLENVVWQNCYVTFTNVTGISASIALQFLVSFIPLQEIKK